MEKILIENNLTKIKEWLKKQIEECTDNDKFLSFEEFRNWKDEQFIGAYANEISFIEFVWINTRNEETFKLIYNELIEEMKKEKEKKEKELDKEARDWLDYWQQKEV